MDLFSLPSLDHNSPPPNRGDPLVSSSLSRSLSILCPPLTPRSCLLVVEEAHFFSSLAVVLRFTSSGPSPPLPDQVSVSPSSCVTSVFLDLDGFLPLVDDGSRG